MKQYLKFSIVLLVAATITSCSNKREPQVQYMPEMYESVPYNANGASGIDGNPVNMKPVDGTIARGNVPFEYANTIADYERAKTDLKSPLEKNQKNLENGKKMYDIYCTSCHGKTGDGNGVLVQREKFLGIPNYKDRDLTEGNIYHVIVYGKNLMGSHASQLTEKERWQVVQYVEQLRNDLLKQ